MDHLGEFRPAGKCRPKGQSMLRTSIYRRLIDFHSILDVSKHHIRILKQGDPWPAIGMRDLDGSPCLLVMGTSPGYSILIARMDRYLPDRLAGSSHPEGVDISATMSNAEENYMSVVPAVISMVIGNPGEFELPIAQDIFGHNKGDGVLHYMMQRLRQVFEHLNIGLAFSSYEVQDYHGGQQLSGEVVAAMHCSTLVPELYVGNRLVYPTDYSGSLALILDKLGLEQLDREHEDEDC
jgi:hypothetical protein